MQFNDKIIQSVSIAQMVSVLECEANVLRSIHSSGGSQDLGQRLIKVTSVINEVRQLSCYR